MRAFTVHTGRVAALPRVNVDTDQIIPKQFLKRVERTGFGEFLFFDWRYRPDGSPDPAFELNRPAARGASVLLAGSNFGCGSSREHAPWALAEYGFRAIVAPSFADIFYNNCFKNGILSITLPQAEIDKLIDDASRGANARITIDLAAQEIRGPDGGVIKFDIDPFRKRCLMEGLDDIGLTMEKADAIADFEAKSRTARPWA